jgi:hypothetical protein
MSTEQQLLQVTADTPCNTDGATSVSVRREHEHPHSELSIHLSCKLTHIPPAMSLRRSVNGSIPPVPLSIKKLTFSVLLQEEIYSSTPLPSLHTSGGLRRIIHQPPV